MKAEWHCYYVYKRHTDFAIANTRHQQETFSPSHFHQSEVYNPRTTKGIVSVCTFTAFYKTEFLPFLFVIDLLTLESLRKSDLLQKGLADYKS